MPPLLAAALLTSLPPMLTAREYQKAEGTWAVVEMTMNGDAIPPAGFKDMRLVLKGATVTAFSGSDRIAEGKYRIVGVKGKRVLFDLTMSIGPDKGRSFPALNEWVDEQTIRTAIGQPGARPTGFAAEPGDGRALFLIKRQKN